MIGWLLKNLIQEVPEQLSVCEFDCPNNECTVKDWVVCDLRQQASLSGTAISRYHPVMAHMEAPAFSAASLVKAIAY